MICFADTFYFLARVNPRDQAHARAVSLPANPYDRPVTTEWILMELADGLSNRRNRGVFAGL